MSFIALTTGEIATGEPVQAPTQTKIKDNFDDHEVRIESLEGSSVSYPCLTFSVNGPYGLAGVVTGLMKTTTNFNMTIVGVRILINNAGASGATEIDILYSRGGAGYQSIFTVKPSIGFAAGNDSLSSPGTLDPLHSTLQAGDIIRLDQTAVQPDGIGYVVRMDYSR